MDVQGDHLQITVLDVPDISRTQLQSLWIGDTRLNFHLPNKPPMDEGEYVSEFLEVLKQLGSSREYGMDHYKRRMMAFVRNISFETLDSIHFETELEQMAAYPIILGTLFVKKRFGKVIQMVNDNISSYLIGGVRGYDYFVGLIVRLFYLSKKNEGQDSSTLFSLLVCNKELGNEYSVSVITNSLLDMFISNKIFQRIENPISTTSEQARYNYYNGMISMVEGEYGRALASFHASAILSNSCSLSLTVEKCIILCMLLISDYNIPYPYKSKLKAYFELVSAVKRADLRRFEEALGRHREEFLSRGLYYIAHRLSQNVIQEGMRKISLVYSRISFEDIASLLEVDVGEVEYLVRRTIKKGIIRGKTVDDVFYSLREDKFTGDVGICVRDCIQLTRAIQEHMRYPRIEPLCYEKIKETYEK